eukprot:4533319-Pyramimonas_sp.AAC.2
MARARKRKIRTGRHQGTLAPSQGILALSQGTLSTAAWREAQVHVPMLALASVGTRKSHARTRKDTDQTRTSPRDG